MLDSVHTPPSASDSQLFVDFCKQHHHLSIIQAENPDGDSIGSALALDELLQNHHITHFCPVQIPRYLRYFTNWSQITDAFDFQANAYIIVDTCSATLLSKLINDPAINNHLFSHPILVIDHHETPDDLAFTHTALIHPSAACCENIYQLAKNANLPISPLAATHLLSGILADTLGFTSQSTSVQTFETVTALVKAGASVTEIEESRRELIKKSPRILSYKADLIKRIDYLLDGQLALVHIPWQDIQNYSDEYNPGALILEELRLVENIKVAIAIKTYPDGKTTGKIRTTLPIAEQIAGFYGGGGHAFAAGFRTFHTSYEDCLADLEALVSDLLDSFSQTPSTPGDLHV